MSDDVPGNKNPSSQYVPSEGGPSPKMMEVSIEAAATRVKQWNNHCWVGGKKPSAAIPRNFCSHKGRIFEIFGVF